MFTFELNMVLSACLVCGGVVGVASLCLKYPCFVCVQSHSWCGGRYWTWAIISVFEIVAKAD